MSTPPIILVPGFWLGAWAWEEVADLLRADGHEVTALTLPGLESRGTDRSCITLADHVDAIRDVTWVDLPTSHWPMWSRPRELAEILGEVARRAAD